MDIQVRAIERHDYEHAYAFQCQYLDSQQFGDFTKRVGDNPDLYLVAVDGNELVGICYGNPSKMDDTSVITLQGIAVNLDETKGYARIGIGSTMMRAFENAVMTKGYRKIGVGSADDPKVEAFYLKNGFNPIELVAKNSRYEEIERVKVDDFETGSIVREGLRRKHSPREVIFIFEKVLD